ncbi:hypothetical protein [Pseudofulvimonas gallinarii]|jgi:hypothetical protein|uniref:Uncharacterized protein n=1 Tax=Pseudofulvimonas gallinarii TaxID=634155 RepID=A0A4S3L048_9GAMM|nr:hypothetical protein [Pseudofulvimonas gallinarii]TCS99179.1 hypothetical protein EDC25_10617 [Pseudofulvimonas gallinarii]THD14014.1 hypothetical protein B1808_05875 [Pseudofulvimonas gallinarii]
MQVIYSTPRLENAERVAALLDEAAIANRVLYGPHHKKMPAWRATNYRQASDPGSWPRVMVLNNGDLPQARQVLRTAGLLPPAGFERNEDAVPALPYVLAPAAPAERRRWVTPGRVRTVLILTVLVLALLQFARSPA